MVEMFPGKLGIIQRVKPSYRVPFFDCLASRCENGLALFAGQPLPIESIAVGRNPEVAKLLAVKNHDLFDPSSRYYFCYQSGLYRRVIEWDPDALIVEANFRYLASPAVMRWMKNRKRPIIGWGLGAKPLLQPFEFLRDQFIRSFDAMVAYSENGAQEYAKIGFPENKIFVAKNAVTDAPTGSPYIRSVDLSKPLEILFVGRLQTRKRVDLLIQAVAAIEKTQRPTLTIVGDGPEKATLESLAQAILPSAQFLGHLEGTALDAEFKKADLFALPGTGGLAIQQAMGFALPVMVAEGDGTQDDLVTKHNGWSLLPGDLGNLIEGLQEAISARGKLPTMGQESFRIVKNDVNIQKMADVFLHAIFNSR